MAVELLERDSFLLTLDEAFCQAGEGRGRIVLVSGEAGIGKTSIVERFIERRQSAARVLWGSCEALFTPRPLGPVYDFAQQAQTPLRARLVDGADRATLFAAVLDELKQGSLPAVLVIEDIHWADEATLDLLKYLARRVHGMAALLLLTYRDDNLSRDHPLRLVLGDLPARDIIRLHLPPLSEAAVAALAAKADRPATDLYLATGGNPFFLTEALASDAPGVPASISDAVLAQISRRSPEAQRLLELVSVAPTKIERWLVEAIGAEDAAAFEECLNARILHLEGKTVGFRHELARQAVESALSPARRQSLNAQVLQAVLKHGVEQTSLARLAHHAAQAEDSEMALRFAPAAAKQASDRGAHREAAAHYATALRFADGLESEQRARLLDGLSHEYYLTRQNEDAVAPCEAALEIWRSLDQKERVGHDLCRLSRLNWILDRKVEAAYHGLAAVELLETLSPGRELSLAYGNMSQLRLLESDVAATLLWGNRAIALAEQLGDFEAMSYALNNVGTAELAVGDERGQVKLEHSLHLALEYGFEDHAARAYANLADEMIKRHDYAQARRYIQDGLAYCAERDLGSWSYCLRGHRARARLDQGDWIGAEEDATAILRVPWASGTNRGPALIVLGSVRLRRGDLGAEILLDEARDLALATGELERVAPMATTRAEWRWLQGDCDQCLAEAKAGFQLALKHHYPSYVGEAAIWLWRGGNLSAAPTGISGPHALQISGDWRAAAAMWEQIGCPYDQALALLDGDESAQREALVIFERLRAAPAADLTRRRLRARGVRRLPRGPRPTTRANPHGLTSRQLEILLLLAEGLHNSEIADRLSTTPKTVEHHVSAVLAKLEVRSRGEAVRVAYELRLLPHAAPPPTANIGM
jgi:DNA-binding CsgD family transcriptional regulator